jgi:ABC-type branched-subunit amino acid transport system substrate-binding protein
MPNKNGDFSMKYVSRSEASGKDSRSDNGQGGSKDPAECQFNKQPCMRDSPAPTALRNRMSPENRPGATRREFLVASASIGALLAFGLPSVRAGEDRPVKVGVLFPREGELAGEAASLMAGFEYFIMEKGVAAPPLDILKRDSGPKDEKTLEALTELVINTRVDFLVGPPSLAGSEKAVHAVAGSSVVLFVTNPSVRLVGGEQCVPGSFRLCANNYQAAQPLAPWALKKLGQKVFITGDDDTQGNEQADYFAYGFEKAGGSFGDRIMVPSGSHKFDKILEAIRKIEADFVFASFRQRSAAEFLKVVRNGSQRLTQSIIGPESLTAFPHTLALADKSAAGVTTLTAMEHPVDFVHRIKKKMGRSVAFASRAAEGYDLAAVIFRALQETGLRDRDVSKTLRVIEDIDIQGPRGRILFDKNHEPILEVMAVQWEGGKSDPTRKIVEKLGPCRTPDFGCGRIGFPKRPEGATKDETDKTIWEENEE